jgi:2-hydroxychromene-2-carboxylate isomerase
MGDLIILADRRAERAGCAKAAHIEFYFDVGCPFSYLTAERIERVLGHVEWVPTNAAGLRDASEQAVLSQVCDVHAIELAAFRAHAETCAVALRLPLVWPDRLASDASGALRASVYARELGAGPRFALAASRLAFCGGFDLDDPEILAEAAAAAGLPLEGCLAAARDHSRDEALWTAAWRLRRRGISRLPAIRVGRRWFGGDQALAEAGALLRARTSARGACAVRKLTAARTPLAPAS